MDTMTFALNIGAALLMGIAIGLERQIRLHTAGLRTNSLVCLGAALFVSLSRLIDHEGSPTRIAAQVVSGIGFLGGGVIFREGITVRGMNTAATLWCAGAIGSLVGAGHLVHGLIGTAAVLGVNISLRPLVHLIEARTKANFEIDTLYRMRVVGPSDQAAVLRTIFMRHVNSQPGMSVQGISTQETDRPDRTAVVADIFSTERNDKYMNDLVSRMSIEPNVSAVSWDRCARPEIH